MNTVTVVGSVAAANGVTLFIREGMPLMLTEERYDMAKVREHILMPLATGANPGVNVDDFKIVRFEGLTEKAGVEAEEKIDGTFALKVDGKTVIEDATALEEIVDDAAHGFGGEALRNFLADFAKIECKHTSDELLQFMRKHDLPIAQDGSIVVYKYLKMVGGEYVDNHTGKVKQKLGSRVSMPREFVNSDRRLDCGAGLHVCSVSYGSYGDNLFLAKVRPSDVVSVPHSETNKMRVAAYHLVSKASDELQRSAGNGRRSFMQSDDGKKLLAAVLAGDHIGITQEVVVHGSAVQIKDVKVEAVPVPKEKRKAAPKKKAAKAEKQKLVTKPTKEAKQKTKAAEVVKSLKETKVTGGKVDPERAKKIAEAVKLFKKGESIRKIALAIGLHRDTISNALKAQGITVAVSAK